MVLCSVPDRSSAHFLHDFTFLPSFLPYIESILNLLYIFNNMSAPRSPYYTAACNVRIYLCLLKTEAAWSSELLVNL